MTRSVTSNSKPALLRFIKGELMQSSSGHSVLQRDYLCLTAFILARHGHLDRARLLIESLLALGEEEGAILTAYAALLFMSGDYAGALVELDRAELAERAGDAAPLEEEEIRTRHYLRTRCLWETSGRQRGQVASG